MNRQYFRRGKERLKCLGRGHQDLARADAYGEEMPQDPENDSELHYCAACGSPVWVKRLHREAHVSSWLNSGLAL